ncbi:hypothetical protein ABTY96_42665 [Streptomyces sp. NPDC096057]|uniref:hypothetical protein n=1 Tax=Streptomyces sp. NPDC096057 TaxID=3155543 RepID=UPI00331CF2A1
MRAPDEEPPAGGELTGTGTARTRTDGPQGHNVTGRRAPGRAAAARPAYDAADGQRA